MLMPFLSGLPAANRIMTCRICVLVVCLFATIAGIGRPARAEFVLSPLRQVMAASAPIADFTVTNSSDRLLDARVSLIDFEATPDGYQLASAQMRAVISAAPWLTIYPIRFSLEPGASQVIRVRLREGFALPDTERRSHLYVEADPARTRIHKISTGGLGLDMQLGISVPVIVRPPLEPSRPPVLGFEQTKLNRTAAGTITVNTNLTPVANSGKPRTSSLYGAVCAEHRSPGIVATTSYGCVENIALYPDTEHRKISLPLDIMTIAQGDLKLIYRGRAEFDGQVLAVKTFRIDD